MRQRSEWRIVAEIDLAIAFVAGNHETMTFTQAKELLPIGQGHDSPGGISRRTDINQLRAFPHAIRNRIPVDVKLSDGSLGT